MNVHGLPVVNLNGTEIEQLIKQHYEVVKAAELLKQKLASAAPHGRDYQHDVTNVSLSTARRDWTACLEAAREIEHWAEVRLNDLQSQNIQRNGHEKAYVILRRAIDKVPA